MEDQFKENILKATGAKKFEELEHVQELWSGYGKITRLALQGAQIDTVIVKHIVLPEANNHPRGWNTNLSHTRKLKSYEVETHWYQHYSQSCDEHCRVARCYGCEMHDNEVLIILEDLDNSGYDKRLTSVSIDQIKLCLKWLANFHGTFISQEPDGLWPVGTYWHLETRPDELEVLKDKPLKDAASAIDRKLNDCQFKTFVHGDAKLANFCFSNDATQVAAVDFQYVGGGCGMKDVAYFIGSCLHDDQCAAHEKQLLQYYFDCLEEALKEKKRDVNFQKLKNEWQILFAVAWTDFHRFIKGWSPGHWKINSYSEQLAKQTLERL